MRFIMCQLTKPLNQAPLSPLPIPDLAKQTKKGSSRLKFWETNSRYHCAALGTCLTLKELRQIGKKAGIKNMREWTDYEMHVSFIHTLDEKSYISTLVNKLLDKKYKISILRFSKTKTEQERAELWNEAVLTGDIAGAFWAILTHPASTENLLFQVYGKVHMLSHLSGATARIDMKEFYQLEQLNESLENKIKKNEVVANKKLEKKEKQLIQLKSKLSTLEIENEKLLSAQQELETIKNSPLVENLQNQVNKLSRNYETAVANQARAEKSEEELKQHANKDQRQKQQMEEQLGHLAEDKIRLEKTLSNLLSDKQQDSVDNCASCPNENPDLCGRCVLYIGGRSSQYSHFRQLVEQQNGTFIHHDGGREDGHQKLASIVSKADVVLCPLDCVSHNAMNAVKRHCQNNTKQLVFIPHASLSAFTKGLGEVN